MSGSIRILGVVLAACQVWAAVPEAVAEAARGGASAREGKYELAIQHYKAALRLDSHLPGLYLNLGLAYFKSERLPEAATAFEEAVRADHSNFQARPAALNGAEQTRAEIDAWQWAIASERTQAKSPK